MSELPCWKIANLRRAVNRARRFPANTCPSSRHLHIMADALSGRGKKYPMFDDEPEHCAKSIYAVILSLFHARNEIQTLKKRLGELDK